MNIVKFMILLFFVRHAAFLINVLNKYSKSILISRDAIYMLKMFVLIDTMSIPSPSILKHFISLS